MITFFAAFFAVCMLISAIRNKKFTKPFLWRMAACGILIVVAQIMTRMEMFMMAKMLIRVPIPTFLLITLICFLLTKFMKTKMGQDMRAIGHDREVAMSSGINVDRTRIIAVINCGVKPTRLRVG